MSRGYTLEPLRGLASLFGSENLYRCDNCPFSTTNHRYILRHVAAHKKSGTTGFISSCLRCRWQDFSETKKKSLAAREGHYKLTGGEEYDGHNEFRVRS